MRLERLSLDEWGEALPETGFEVFHTPEALAVLEDHVDADLHLLAGYNGDQVVGLYPAFVRSSPVGRAVLSPPPGWSVPQLGPIVMPTSPKQRKREQVNQAFTEAVLESLGVGDRRTVFRTVCHPEYPDPRPYIWSDIDHTTEFTYRLEIGDDTAGLLDSFSRSLRREIRDGQSLEVTVERAEPAGWQAVYDQLQDRYIEQGRGFTLTRSYVGALVERLADAGRARTYVARDRDGRFLSGIIALYSNDVALYWLGGTRTMYEGVSINGLLHWSIIEDIGTDPPRETIWGYDLMGANTERLCEYKGKFGAELAPHYVLESNGAATGVAKAIYRRLRR